MNLSHYNSNDVIDLATYGFPSDHRLFGYEEGVIELQAIGRQFYSQGWSVGTSSNYSVVHSRDPLSILVTASGMDKGRLKVDDFVRVNSEGKPEVEDQPKSSAETQLHVVVANHFPNVQCILHTHSVWGTVLSDQFFEQGYVEFDGFEMLKGLEGIKTHQTNYRLPIFENTQDIPVLADQVEKWLTGPFPDHGFHGYLIRNHGLYTWGNSVAEARRHIEVFEFLFQCKAASLQIRG